VLSHHRTIGPSHHRTVLVLVLASLLLTAACAAAPPPKATPPSPTVNADTLIRRGCYACLEEAFTALSAGGAGERAFETALLLVARSKELGLPSEVWLERAAALLPSGPEWTGYLEIVQSLRPDPLSGERELDTTDFARARRGDAWDMRRERLKSGPASAMVRTYLDLAIACRSDAIGRMALDSLTRDAATAAALQEYPGVPLVQYRAGLCGGADLQQLDSVRASDEAFVDADLELGRLALQNRVPPDVTEGMTRLESARRAFPATPVPAIVLGNLHASREEWPEALAAYDASLAIVPAHRDGLLGRTVSLSNLDRYEEALASANRLLELKGATTGPAHYWRAWNQYQLDRIIEARADADQAKALMVNAALFVLSGMIEWKEKRLESADAEFGDALSMDFGQCDAAFYLATVRFERRMWPESLAAFMHAQQCFDLSIVTRTTAVADLSKTPEEAALNAAMIASHQRAIDEAQRRRGQAAQNSTSLQKFIDTNGR
jgi:tetratricopeptide (TPR) repeat protein